MENENEIAVSRLKGAVKRGRKPKAAANVPEEPEVVPVEAAEAPVEAPAPIAAPVEEDDIVAEEPVAPKKRRAPRKKVVKVVEPVEEPEEVVEEAPKPRVVRRKAPEIVEEAPPAPVRAPRRRAPTRTVKASNAADLAELHLLRQEFQQLKEAMTGRAEEHDEETLDMINRLMGR